MRFMIMLNKHFIKSVVCSMISAQKIILYTQTNPMALIISVLFVVHRNLPDVTFSIEEMFAAGNRVIVRYIMRGTQPVELQALPATGKKIEVSGIMIHRIENGRVVEDREEFDMFGLNRQLGMELKPKEVKK